jgi:hypothetical protein
MRLERQLQLHECGFKVETLSVAVSTALLLAASVSAKTESWLTFWHQLAVDMNKPLDTVFDAMAIGWTWKWQSKD